MYTMTRPWLTVQSPHLALLSMRVIAFSGGKLRAVVFIWTVYVGCALASILVMIKALDASQEAATVIETFCGMSGACPDSFNPSPQWDLWVPGMIMESVLIVCTLAHGVVYWRRGTNSTLISVIIEDNLLYFVCVFVMMAINVGICAVPDLYTDYGVLTELTLCINSILASRIFLHLRAAAYPDKLNPEYTVNWIESGPIQRDESSTTEGSGSGSWDSWSSGRS